VIDYHLQPNRYAWLQIAQGVVTLNGEELRSGDGVQLSGEEKLSITTNTGGEILLFDLG
jgi:redox-sensitive bicupin YhaK (pirin superfamily)